MLTTANYDQSAYSETCRAIATFDTLRALFYMDRDFKGWDLSAAWANTKLACSPMAAGRIAEDLIQEAAALPLLDLLDDGRTDAHRNIQRSRDLSSAESGARLPA
jgi:hypothetical protein